MKNYTQILLVFLATTCGILLVNFTSQQTKPQLNKSIKITTDYKVKKTKEEWKKTLNDEEYRFIIFISNNIFYNVFLSKNFKIY